MAKRGYKLQEFLAHSANVNCLNIGKKACRLFITGGDDHKVNVWTIGKPTSIMSLSGHTSPVESVAFDSAEVLVLAGASTGVVKQWDLEEGKVVRTLTGHRSNCTAVEFHPFGEFFASGSMDTNLRIWDLRKKGCIHTYRGHTQGVSTIKFTPDGRWVVSGGLDNVVKVWDLTAGKLLHDFKFHDGHIRSLDFHPLEFLLATGSADRTVKFWDLETFEMIGSTRPEASGVRAITFHPDGRTLFSGLEDSLKVYSWEPVISHDAVDVGWSTLGDLCIHDGKLLGCSYYRNSVGVWVADISLIEPYGDGSQNDCMEQKFDLKLKESSEKLGSGGRTSSLRCRSPDYDTKDIKNIYVDSTGGKPVASQNVESLTSPKVVPHIDSKDTSAQPTPKQSPAFVVPSIVPRDTPDGKDSVNSTRESITFSRTKRGMLLRPAHIRRPSNSKNDVEKLPSAFESGTFGNLSSDINSASDPKCQTKGVTAEPRESSEERNSSINNVAEKLEKVLSPKTPVNQEICNKALDSSKETHSVKFVNGVAVVRGRTRSLVERFEKRERVNTIDDQATDISTQVIPEMDKTHPTPEKTHPTPEKTHSIPEKMHPKTHSALEKMHPTPVKMHPTPEKTHPTPEKTHPTPEKTHPTPEKMHPKTHSTLEKTHPTTHSTPEKTHPTLREEPQVSRRDSAPANEWDASEILMQNHDLFLSTLRSRLTKLQVVRHFWERNDIKGAIGALRKLPDHSVQADIVSVLMEKRDILTLDLFSCLLPVLLGLLDSKIERHATVSLELLLKLVAVFGSVIQTAISTPRAVGVDLHAEQRIACCNECSIQLQKIQKILPSLVRKGGLVAKSALELSLVLQVS